MTAIKHLVREHYDRVSPYYQRLWGNHIHHGYYITGKETKEAATEALTAYVTQKARIKPKSKVLDVGCGVGGTAMWLARRLGCSVTGVTISPVQAQMATDAAVSLAKPPRFLVGDAEALPVKESFDAIIALEMVSHLPQRQKLFKQAGSLLRKGGMFCVVDWMKDTNLTNEQEKRYISPIEKGMIVTLSTIPDYVRYFEQQGLRVVYVEDVSARVQQTWDVGIDIIRDRSLWSLALKEGKQFYGFLKAFQAMRAGFRSGAFRYVVLVAEKP